MEETGPVQIEFPHERDENEEKCVLPRAPDEADFSRGTKCNISEMPVPDIDSRAIAWEAKRPRLQSLPKVDQHQSHSAQQTCISNLKDALGSIGMSPEMEDWLKFQKGNFVLRVPTEW